MINVFGHLPRNLRQTLTLDNGSEHSRWRSIERYGGVNIFFAHPYHSWERGTNENTNGLIRWYLPKKTDFSTISVTTIQAIEDALNNRPRKRLGWKTPLEVFNESRCCT
jgi:IS30 family transposase